MVLLYQLNYRDKVFKCAVGLKYFAFFYVLSLSTSKIFGTNNLLFISAVQEVRQSRVLEVQIVVIPC